MIVPCECGAKLKINEAKIGPQGIKIRCPRCGYILPVKRHAPDPVRKKETVPGAVHAAGDVVLVAHDSQVVRDTISSVLVEAGFRVDTAKDGAEALCKATETPPKALVLDVGLPRIYGFELCERLKGSRTTAGIKIILLSSVYDKRRYKRTPVNLYGADDYIEKHHIVDFLALKVRKLIYPEQFAAAPPDPVKAGKSELPEMARPPAREFQPSLLQRQPQDEEQQAAPLSPAAARSKRVASPPVPEESALFPESFSLDRSIFQKEECDIPRVEEADPAAVEKAKRFARIIVSDIALYNQEAVAQGLRNGSFYDLLKTDIDEGRELYENRVPDVIRKQKDYYQEAFDNFIAGQRKNVR